MPFSLSDTAEPSPFVVRAELALRNLKQHVTTHMDRESRLCRVYGEWQETWLSRGAVQFQIPRDLNVTGQVAITRCVSLAVRCFGFTPQRGSPKLAQGKRPSGG